MELSAISSQPSDKVSNVSLLKSPGGVNKNQESEALQKKLADANNALKQLQAEFTSYKKEKLENEKYETFPCS